MKAFAAVTTDAVSAEALVKISANAAQTAEIDGVNRVRNIVLWRIVFIAKKNWVPPRG